MALKVENQKVELILVREVKVREKAKVKNRIYHQKEMAVVEYVLTYELQMQQVRAAPRAPAQRCFERPCASAQGPPGPS